MPVTVIPHKHWHHVSGRTASIYGASPWTSQADKPNWTLVERGYTTLNPDGTVGREAMRYIIFAMESVLTLIALASFCAFVAVGAGLITGVF